jgi:FAD binding domain
MEWDDEADIVCVGSGAAGLACAIVAVDAGLEVFVAEASNDRAGADSITVPARPVRRRFCPDVVDSTTNEYFDALSQDLGPLSRRPREADVPIRVIDASSRSGHDRHAVEPFIGTRLRDWAARCLASPYGFLYTRVSDRMTTKVRTKSGEAIEVARIGSVEPGHATGQPLADWLVAQGRNRGLQVRAASPLERIVFEGGDVAGAVFATSEGPHAVRARRGVTVATAGRQPVNRHQTLAGHTTVRVCLVRKIPSRFGRIELVTTEPLAQSPSAGCRPLDRRLPANVHETQQGPSHTTRCRKVHRYPPIG